VTAGALLFVPSLGCQLNWIARSYTPHLKYIQDIFIFLLFLNLLYHILCFFNLLLFGSLYYMLCLVLGLYPLLEFHRYVILVPTKILLQI